MNLSALRSELSRVERELSRVEAINRELKNELSVVARGASSAHDTLENYNKRIQNSLSDANKMMHASHQRVIDAVALQGQIEKLYVRFKNIELANKKIRMANNKKYYDFSTYRTVRKIVQGIMDNLDVHMVSDQTVMKSVERQHLQVPDYWLTCVLISVMAWKADDKALADRAVARAVTLDKKHSAIFYMLFNLRFERNDAALKWFNTYQECEQKGDDQQTFLMLFSLISKTLSQSVDEKVSTMITAYINRIILSSAQAKGYSESAIIAEICHNYAKLQPAEHAEYAMLKRYCGTFDELEKNIAKAKNNVNILGFILRTVHVPVEEKNQFLKGYVDELIATPNPAEVSVYEEIAYHELVIKLEGDADRAKAQFEAEQQRAKGDINLIVEIIDWIYDRGNQEINGQIRLNMFTLTKDLQEKAIAEYTEDYRRRKTTVAPVTINDYSTTVDFKQEDEEMKKVEAHYTEIKNNTLSAIKNWNVYFGFGVAVLGLAGGFFFNYWVFAITALGIGVGILSLFSNRSQRKQATLACQDHTRNAIDILQKVFSEFKQYQEQFDEFDAYHDKIVDELNKI